MALRIGKGLMTPTELETRNPKLETDLREVAQDIVGRAMAGVVRRILA